MNKEKIIGFRAKANDPLIVQIDNLVTLHSNRSDVLRHLVSLGLQALKQPNSAPLHSVSAATSGQSLAHQSA